MRVLTADTRAGGRRVRPALVLAPVIWLAAVVAGWGPANACSEADFAAAVDKAGAALRQFNQEHAPKVSAGLKSLQTKRGWTDQELEAKAITFLHTGEIARLDEQANELLTKIDELGEVTGNPDCARLPELERAGRDLLATMQEKTKLTQAAIAAALAEGDAAAQPARVAEKGDKPAPTASPPEAVAKSSPETPPRKPAPASSEREQTWTAATTQAPRDDLIALKGLAPTAGEAPTQEPAATGDARGYTIDEIKTATRGFFGTISTNLASVIEYAFSHYGRPSAYVLGSEGGGAFLAGARFGKGKLYMRAGGQHQVYWHGPSIGYDFGAEGSRTLFLIYKLDTPEDLFRRYAGVDGSAYVLGGVGLTVLKGGPVLMAPIRTGVGLRLGANIGYVRFTRNATWNPF